MVIKTIEGVVENGKIRLLDDLTLPENTRVYVLIADQNLNKSAQLRTPHLAHAEQAADFRKQILEVRDDAKL